MKLLKPVLIVICAAALSALAIFLFTSSDQVEEAFFEDKDGKTIIPSIAPKK